MINPETTKLTEAWIARKIDERHFKEKLKKVFDISAFNTYLDDAFTRQNSEEISYLFIIGFTLDLFCQDNAPMLRALLAEDWHKNHEDLLYIFQHLVHDPLCVDPVITAINNPFPYLLPNDLDSFITKGLYVLNAVNTEYALAKLVQLRSSENEIVRKCAKVFLDH